MATDYPGALDTTKLTSPNTTDKTNSPSHAGLHANANDAIKAIEAKVGTGASTPVVSTLLFGTGTGTSAWTQLTSAQLAASLSDETGTGSAVFATTPTLVTPKIDTINESTPSNGTTVGGVNIKSGALNTNNSVVTANITNAAVTPSKLGTGATSSVLIATDESTSSTSFVDLTTTTDSVTVTIGANGLAVVILNAALYNNTATGHSICGFAVSGASTVAATVAQSLDYQIAASSGSTVLALSGVFFVSGLTAGSNTFKMKYAQSVSGVAHAFNRKIAVVPL